MTLTNRLNSFLTPEIFSKEAAIALEHELVMKNLVSTTLSKEFKSIGSFIDVRDFNTFKVRKNSHVFGGENGETINKIDEKSIPVCIEYQDGLDLEYTAQEASMDIDLDDFHNNYIKPAASTLAEYIDRTVLEKIQEVDFNMATVSDYINNPDIYNNKLKTIPKINAARGVAIKVGIPSAGSNFLFSTNMSTILSNEISGALATEQPAKLLERGYVTTMRGGAHIYETPSLLPDYNVYKAKETSTLLTDDAIKYAINIIKGKGNVEVKQSGDKTKLTIGLELEKSPDKPKFAKPAEPTTEELDAQRKYDNYQRQLAALENYVDHKIYLEGLTY